ncbi:MAG: hypothetical protein LBU85_12580 [Treponema sp.]|jgi:hypothetical protein|nr:hypothetical protein [Treponema sp.]
MKRKLAMLLFIATVSFVYSCLDYSLPDQIKIDIETEKAVELPVRIGTGNWGSALIESLQDSLMAGVRILDVNYGQEVQSFCVYAPVDIDNGFDFDDYMKDIDKLTETPAMKIEQEIDIPAFDQLETEIPLPQTLSTPGGITVYDPIPIHFSGEIDTKNKISEEFLHARIEEGVFRIELELSQGNVRVEDKFTTQYDIKIKQDPDSSRPGGPYSGLDYLSPQDDLTITERSLNKQNINTNKIVIDGTVTLQPTENFTLGGPLDGKLKIKMNFTKFAEIDLDFNKISKELKPDPVSLADVAKVLNWIKFNKCAVNAKGEPLAGIGINVHFTEIIDGLAMSVGCDDLRFDSTSKALKTGTNIVFGNKDDLQLSLANYKNDVKKLQFDIALAPSGGSKSVLHLTNLEVGKQLHIKGEAKLFQHWTEAEVNMKELTWGTSHAFTGEYPASGEEPIDVSSLFDDFLEGFSFEETDITAAVYLSGPETSAMFKLEINANYNNNDSDELINSDIKFGNAPIVIDNYLDGEGTYKIGRLPEGGKSVNNLASIINKRPKDLRFNYCLALPDAITVKPDTFNESIKAAVMLLIKLKLTAGANGGSIKFPDTDMFEDTHDLLGREPDKNDPSKPQTNFLFTSLDVDYIKLTVDYSSVFSTGGKLYIEKTPALFPDGIPLNDKSIVCYITGDRFNYFKDNFIVPDFRLEFKPGGTITIPRNIGLVSIKLEAKGKYSTILDL